MYAKIVQPSVIGNKNSIFATINNIIMKKRITQDDYIKANRKASREAEIEMYGHPICHKRVHQSKKYITVKR